MKDSKQELLLDNLVYSCIKQEYDFLFLVSIKDCLIVDSIESPIKREMNIKGADYDNIIDNILCAEFIPEDFDILKNKTHLENVVEKLQVNSFYNVQYTRESAILDIKAKEICFWYYDNTKELLCISIKDISKFTVKNATEKRKLTVALNEAMCANEAKSDFLSRMSHDMRTPLNGIIGLTGLAKDEKNIDTIKKYLDDISLSSTFLLGLINDIIDMSMIEQKKVILHPEQYSLIEFINYLKAIIGPLCTSKNQKFEIKIAKNIPQSVLCDKLRVNQVFINLLSNASKYTPYDGQITLSIRRYDASRNDNAYLQFEVLDNGIGMSKEFLEKVFEPFTREEKGNKVTTQGTGLGLSITKLLVEMMRGTIKIDSTLNVGTRVLVHLFFPLDPSKKNSILEEKLINNESFKCLEGRNILLAEDTQLNAFIVVSLLEKLGMSVITAKNGQEALDIFMENEVNYFDAILMDIRMPVMDGFESTKAIRSLTRQDAKQVPIIAVTANAFEEDIQMCLQSGMNAHISKPIEPKKLYLVLLHSINK